MKAKRLWGILLAVCLLMSSLAVTGIAVSAEEIPTIEILSPQTAVIGETAVSGMATVPADAAYTVALRWCEFVVEDGIPLLSPFDGVFEKGKVYVRKWIITAADDWSGWAMAVDGEVTVDLLVDGEYLDTAWVWDDLLTSEYLGDTFDFTEKITAVTVSGITDAVVGEAPTTNGIAVPEDAPYTATAAWFTYDEEYNEIPVEAFEKGNIYYLNISLLPNEGYSFAEDCAVTVNGEESDEAFVLSGEVSLTLEYNLTESIESVDISGVTEAAIGETAIIDGITVPEDAPYTVVAEWITMNDELEEEPFNGEFVIGQSYFLNLTVTAADGYTFTDDCVVTVNGEEPDFSFVMGSELFIKVSYNLATPIESVDITGTEKVEVGKTASVDGISVSEDALYTIEAFWLHTDTVALENSGEPFVGKFEKDQPYMLVLSAQAKDGYTFTEDTAVTFNGKKLNVDRYLNMESFMLIFADQAIAGQTAIETLELSFGDLVGKTPDEVEVTLPEDAPYTIDEVVWLDAMGMAPVEGAFEKDRKYMLSVSVIPKEGYYMAGNMVTLINGKDIYDYEFSLPIHMLEGSALVVLVPAEKEVPTTTTTATTATTTTAAPTTTTAAPTTTTAAPTTTTAAAATTTTAAAPTTVTTTTTTTVAPESDIQTSPLTGDMDIVMLLISVMVLSAAGIAIVLTAKRDRAV